MAENNNNNNVVNITIVVHGDFVIGNNNALTINVNPGRGRGAPPPPRPPPVPPAGRGRGRGRGRGAVPPDVPAPGQRDPVVVNNERGIVVLGDAHDLVLRGRVINVYHGEGTDCDQEPHDEQLYLASFVPDQSRFISAGNMTRGDKCVVDCIRNSSIPSTVQRFFFDVEHDVFKRQNSTNIRRVFNATMLEWYCRYANGRQQCISECDSDSFLKTEILKLLRPTSYVCNETDFIAYSKCYRQVYDDDVDECESGDKCLPYKTAMIDYVHEKKRSASNKSWEEAVQFLLNNLCQYIICGNQCRTNELSTRCGEESNQVLIEFYRRVVASFKQIIVQVHRRFKGGTELILTDMCDQI